jgi:hypothetical protein
MYGGAGVRIAMEGFDFLHDVVFFGVNMFRRGGERRKNAINNFQENSARSGTRSKRGVVGYGAGQPDG